MSTLSDFGRYRGNGVPPIGKLIVSRDGEPGRYLADDDDTLKLAVNTALALKMPLLLTGDPGTGKSTLAWSIATELGLGAVVEFLTRSDHTSRDVLYTFDHMRRLYDTQAQDARAKDPRNYVTLQPLGEAIKSSSQRLVLIDEIDKAPRDFANDLLNEIERLRFRIPETSEEFVAVHQPIVVITSNSTRELPDAFLRRCIFHWIEFPSADRLERILRERLSGLNPSPALCRVAMKHFDRLRQMEALERKPSTAELINWVALLLHAGIDLAQLEACKLDSLPAIGLLLKTRHDQEHLRVTVKH